MYIVKLFSYGSVDPIETTYIATEGPNRNAKLLSYLTRLRKDNLLYNKTIKGRDLVRLFIDSGYSIRYKERLLEVEYI